MRIVGIVNDSTALAGQPNVFVTVAGAQQLSYGGQPLVTSIGIRGTPAEIPDGYRVRRPRRRRRRPTAAVAVGG